MLPVMVRSVMGKRSHCRLLANRTARNADGRKWLVFESKDGFGIGGVKLSGSVTRKEVLIHLLSYGERSHLIRQEFNVSKKRNASINRVSQVSVTLDMC